MPRHQAEVIGTVKYREGEGIEMSVPLGPCEIELTEADATITWTDGSTRGAAAIPLSDYARFVNEGVLRVGTVH